MHVVNVDLHFSINNLELHNKAVMLLLLLLSEFECFKTSWLRYTRKIVNDFLITSDTKQDVYVQQIKYMALHVINLKPLCTNYKPNFLQFQTSMIKELSFK